VTAETLFDLTDFEETKPPLSSGAVLMYECGAHRWQAEWEAHLAECWGGTCPGCGQAISTWFDMHTNHGEFQRPAWPRHLCSKQHILMNHCIAAVRSLDGEWASPWTNCHARSHHEAHPHAFKAKGMPPECAAAEYVEKRAWLTAHRVPVEEIASPSTDAGIAIVAKVELLVAAWLAEGGVVA
jgi:hypothetical protein